MRVFLVISRTGDGLSLTQRIKEEGHRAILYINDPHYRGIGEGLVEKSAVEEVCFEKDGKVNLEVAKKLLSPTPDCVVFDMVSNGSGKLAEYFSGVGVATIGSSVWAELVSLKDTYANTVLASLKFNLHNVGKVGVVTEAWFNGSDVIGVAHSISDWGLMEGQRGPLAYMGTTVLVGGTASKLYKEGVDKLVPAMKRTKYCGPIRLFTMVDEQEFVVSGMSAGLSLYAPLLEAYKGRINDLLYGLATGVLKYMDFKSEWAMCATIAVPPYPYYVAPTYSKDTEIEGLNRHNLKHVWLYDVYKKDDKYRCAGNGGCLGVVTARGDVVEQYSPLRDAKRRILRTISNLCVNSLMYRTDIGDTALKGFTKLKKWGWI